MDTNCEYIGKWWLPEKPEEIIEGRLKYNAEEGTVIELHGKFTSGITFEQDIMLGLLSTGEEVTLYHCFAQKTSMSSSGFDTSIISVDLVFLGCHCIKPEELVFDGAILTCQHLDSWYNKSGVSLSTPPSNETVITCKSVPPIEITIGKEYKVSFIVSNSIDISILPTNCSIKEKTYLQIDTSSRTSFDRIRKITRDILHFISLGTGVPAPITSIEYIIKSEKPKYIKVLFKKADENCSYKVRRQTMLFSFDDIAAEIEVYLNNWILNLDILEPVIKTLSVFLCKWQRV